jgi:integrase
MQTKTPRVMRKVHVDGAWVTLPVAKIDGKNGPRFEWEFVVRKGVRIPVAAGTFYLEYKERPAPGEKPRKIRRAVGATAHDARTAVATQGAVLELRAQGVETDDAPAIQERKNAAALTGKRISEVAAAFKRQPPIKLRARSIAKYNEALSLFEDWARKHARKTHVSQLGRQDIQDFMSYVVRVQGRSLSTAVGKATLVKAAMRSAGAVIEEVKGDRPKVTQKQPEMYTPELLRPLFKAMTPAESTLYQTFLLTGFRFQEIQYLAWSDFIPKGKGGGGRLKVTKKAGYNFDPKNYKERTIPIPPVLVQLLKKHRAAQREGEYFVFATPRSKLGRGASGGQPDSKMLDKLKKIALRAGLNCGRCHSTWQNRPANCSEKPICRVWTLHKFRHTYATTLLQDGFDIISVQELLGHDDLESTMKYLRAMRQENLADKINKSAISTMYV